MKLTKTVRCPECNSEMKPWEGAGRSEEIYTCQDPNCEIIKILVVRQEDLR